MSLLLSKVKEGLQRTLKDPASKYIVAYSGGPDSTFLLAMLVHFGYSNILPVYINYLDSPYVEEEQRIVIENCRHFSLPLKLIRLKEPLDTTVMNFEKAARDFRYREFSKIASEEKAEGVITAHQKDDDLCTYLMQKERKGIVTYYGLKNISFIYGVKVYRPFLDITKKEMRDYLLYMKIPFYDDITNKNYTKTRNSFRDIILPQLNMEEVEKEKEKANIELNYDRKEIKPDKVIPYSVFRSFSLRAQRMTLYSLISKVDKNAGYKEVNAGVNLALASLTPLHSTTKTRLSKVSSLYRNYEGFYIREDIPLTSYEYHIERKGLYKSDFFSFDLIHNLDKTPIKNSDFPLTVRNVKSDDVFATNIISDSVKNFIKKQRVPSYLREFYPVFLNNKGKVIFVPFYEDMKKAEPVIRFRKFHL